MTRIASLTLCLTALFAVSAAATIDKTTRKGLKVDASAINHDVKTVADTLHGPITDSIYLAGYDKPLRSTRESLFVTNRSDRDIDGLVIETEYRDMAGRQLHKRTVTISCDIPAGETRRVDFRSWDRQQSFYYRLSPKPKRSQATPYDVTCRTIGVIVSNHDKTDSKK